METLEQKTKKSKAVKTKDKHESSNFKRTGVMGVEHLFSDNEESGNVTISKIEFKEEHDILYNLRARRDGNWFLQMYEGTYVRLHINKKLFMSDTCMERITNAGFIKNAHGHVLIGGLGVGLLIHNIVNKKDVLSITIVENNEDVIKLVAPKFNHEKVTVVYGSIFDYTPTQKFDSIYFDIWESICEDNLDDMGKLHRRYGKFKNKENPKAFISSWMREYLQKQRRKDRRNNYWAY